MARVLWSCLVIGSGALGLVVASAAAADTGKARVNVSFSCLGVVDSAEDEGSPFADVEDAIRIGSRSSRVFLDAAATADLVGGEVVAPTHSAVTGVETNGIVLQPFDVCGSAAESALDSVVVGSHVSDSAASGVADVEFHFEFAATLQVPSRKGKGSFAAYAGTELELLGVDLDAFEVSAEGKLVQAPPGLTVVKSVHQGERIYEISGTYVVEGQLLYGPGVRNVVKTTFYAGSEVTNDNKRSRVVRGFAAVEALNSVRYEIVSLDPNVIFDFVEAPQ